MSKQNKKSVALNRIILKKREIHYLSKQSNTFDKKRVFLGGLLQKNVS